MRSHILSLSALLGLAHCSPAPAPTPPTRVVTPPVASSSPDASIDSTARPPVALRVPVVDEYFGVKVTDDYRWLENAHDPQVRLWTIAQNQFSRAHLDALPARPSVKTRVAALLGHASADHFALRKRGKTFFAMKDQPPKQQPFLVTMTSLDDAATERAIVDPNTLDANGKTAIDFYVPSLDGKLVAVSLSEGGSESGTVHVYDVATGKAREDVVPRVNGGTAGGSVAWAPDGRGFYYTRYPREGERPPADMDFYQQLYFHELGKPTKDDRYELGKDFPRIAEISLRTSDDGRYVVASVANGDGGEHAQWVRGPAGKWTQLSRFEDKIVHAEFGRDDSIFLLSHAAPHGKVLRVSARAPSLEKAEEIVPESDVVVQDFEATATKLYVTDIVGGPSQLRVVPLKRDPKATAFVVPTPPVSTVGQLLHLGGDELVFRSESFTEPPAWYKATLDGSPPKRTAMFMTSEADFKDSEVVRETCTSKDGTKVPMSILRRKGTPMDGSAPLLLNGYGGYNVIKEPHFNAGTRAWVEQGGIFVSANLRGGGELGSAWHEQGKLTKKQNVFDDFFACATTLVDRGYTKKERLAIIGGSNGGLLMGAELTQHPDAFRAIVSFVGIYDMLRVELAPNGEFNVTEFGTVKDKAQFDALFAYSPFHHVVDKTPYPAMLMLTGANDPRVDPYHSRKMTARLQAATSSTHPILLRTSDDSGHGIGTPLAEQIEEESDVYAFLFDELGLTYKAP
jgi:prolyl oligopeptidase